MTSIRPGASRPPRAHLHVLGADAMAAVHRLLKTALVHHVDNDAVVQSAEQARRAVIAVSDVGGESTSLTFVHDMIFVCGQLLRASRAEYDAATELGRLLARCGASEVTFAPGVRRDDLSSFAAIASAAARDPARRGELVAAEIPHVAVRQVEALIDRAREEAGLPEAERLLRLYATAIVVMRGVLADVARGTPSLPHRVKRLAQRLVMAMRGTDPALVGLASLAPVVRDDAGRAVHTALCTLLAARELTSDRGVLSRLALAALGLDAGRVRLVGERGDDPARPLSTEAEMAVPASTASVTIASGGVQSSAASRATVVFETVWLERRELMGELWGGAVAPTFSAVLLHAARAYVDAISVLALSPPAALAHVRPSVDPLAFRLLIRGLGVLPVGTVVELASGEWGVVAGTSRASGAHDRPLVRLVTDARGRAAADARELDLAAADTSIRRVLGPDEAAFNAASALF